MSQQTFDLAVVGAGPAGAAAAVAASRCGARVALIDEASAPGGQVYRAPAPGLKWPSGNEDSDIVAGETLRKTIEGSSVTWLPGRRVWAIAGGFKVDVAGPRGHEELLAPRLVAATGAHERIVPFPGWTMPGVIGLAATTILIKSQAMVPGGRVVIAGCGPLLAAVAGKVAASGGNIAAVADLASPWEWVNALPALARRPRLLRRGIGWALSVGRQRIPVHFRHAVISAHGNDRLESVRLGPVDARGAPLAGEYRDVEADVLSVGHGLVPGGEITRLLRARMQFDRGLGGWVPVTDAFGRTDVPGLYAAGDGAGIRGAEPAALQGELAGLAAMQDLGKIAKDAFQREADPLLRRLESYRPFAAAVAGMMALRPEQVRAIAPRTVVCRCEDVTKGEIESAAAGGALDVNQMKHFTRCGMGPCQGRMCGDVAAEILAQARAVGRADVGYWTGRPPLRPVPLADLVGTFDYSDIPIPKPAPL